MILTTLAHLVEGAPAQPQGREALYAAAATFLVVAGKAIMDHTKGRKRPSELNGLLDQKLKPIIEGVTTLSGEVRDLRAWVVGPDGRNGLRGDLGQMEKRVDGLEERERDRLTEERLHGPMDRRTG